MPAGNLHIRPRLLVISCDDGVECTTDDLCDETGSCVNAEECVCSPEFSEIVSKVRFLAVGSDGQPGMGWMWMKIPHLFTGRTVFGGN